jgi:hypothetical protein
MGDCSIVVVALTTCVRPCFARVLGTLRLLSQLLVRPSSCFQCDRSNSSAVCAPCGPQYCFGCVGYAYSTCIVPSCGCRRATSRNEGRTRGCTRLCVGIGCCCVYELRVLGFVLKCVELFCLWSVCGVCCVVCCLLFVLLWLFLA